MPDRPKTQIAADAWGTLLRVHADLVPAMDLELRGRNGLPLGWYDILLELNFADEHALTMSELADRVVLSRTRVSRVVDELAVQGLVERQQHPGDKRSAFAVLTNEGRRRFRDAAPVYLAAIDKYVAGPLSKAELETLRQLLEKLVPVRNAASRAAAIRA
jgi:DNA-binding MarR family transcriptional regulator